MRKVGKKRPQSRKCLVILRRIGESWMTRKMSKGANSWKKVR
jgi:hypothetical protein